MKNSLKIGAISLITIASLSILVPNSVALAAENNQNDQTSLWDIEDDLKVGYDSKTQDTSLPENVVVDYDEDGPVIIVLEEGVDASKFLADRIARATVYKWGAWSYTNIAISTGVLAGAINSALYAGIGVVAGTIGLPALAIGGLLTASQWTKLGNAPGNAVAKDWDKNGNGWVGFYVSKGYDGAGKVVATRYKTK